MAQANEQVIIRPAVLDDTAAMARVLVDTYRIAHRGQVPDRLLDFPPIQEAYAESERNWRRALIEIASTPQPRERVFVAVESELIVGLGMGLPCKLPEPDFGGFAGEVVCLYVLPTYQHRGIGRQILRAIFQHLAMAGLLPIAIGCLTANLPARLFYEALGGQVVGERIRLEEGMPLPETVFGWQTSEAARLIGDGGAIEETTGPRRMIREELERKAEGHHPRPRSLGLGDSGRTDIARRTADKQISPEPWR